jgi:hypothetical protein
MSTAVAKVVVAAGTAPVPGLGRGDGRPLPVPRLGGVCK